MSGLWIMGLAVVVIIPIYLAVNGKTNRITGGGDTGRTITSALKNKELNGCD
jgi:hypothetical protein